MRWTAGTPLPVIGNRSGTDIVAEAAQCDGNGDEIIGNLTYAANPLTWNGLATGATDFQITPPRSFKGSLATKTAAIFNYAADDIYHNYSRRPVARNNGGLNIIYVDGHVGVGKVITAACVCSYLLNLQQGYRVTCECEFDAAIYADRLLNCLEVG